MLKTGYNKHAVYLLPSNLQGILQALPLPSPVMAALKIQEDFLLC